MTTKKAFCEECGDETEYTVTPVTMTGTIKGKEYHYSGQEARCMVCGSPVYLPELNDANLEALYDVFREENGIISLEAVRAIPKKYAIGKRRLSLLLGWGEQTFTRYYDGDTPSRQYSDILRRVYNEPEYYAELLERNKEKLTSAAYEKSRRAVDALLDANPLPDSKIDAVTQYLLKQCGDITGIALQKVLYYIQGFYYAFFGSFLFAEDCQAWVHGPVYRDIYCRYRYYRDDLKKKADTFDASGLSASERAVCDSVIRHLCCYNGTILERFTHNETPWLTARGTLPDSASSERVIPKDHIGAYFEAVKAKYNMVNPSDISDYARDMLRKI
ncbi:MAG: DUF4065 domain-containing protein [Oscillibacter sp.]|nr:DUF4065 domain-containing protein [Oscillibacter sp.]